MREAFSHVNWFLQEERVQESLVRMAHQGCQDREEFKAYLWVLSLSVMPPSHWATISYDAKDHTTFWKLAWTWGDLGRNLTIQCIFFNIWHGRVFDTLMLVYVTLTLRLCTVLLRSHCVCYAFLPRCFHVIAAAATTMLLKVRVDWAAAACIQCIVRCYYVSTIWRHCKVFILTRNVANKCSFK